MQPRDAAHLATDTIVYDIRHHTRYRYEMGVSLAHNQAHLRPRSTLWQTCRTAKLAIQPAPIAQHPWEDFFGNQVDFFNLENSHQALDIEARSVVEVRQPTWPEAERTVPWEVARDSLIQAPESALIPVLPFRFESPYIKLWPEARDFALVSFTPGRPLLDAALHLMNRIHRDFKYVPGATDSHTSPREVFQRRAGVCQDFAHVALACLRSLGLAARYVSGYLQTDPPPGQPKLIGADASHAWFSVYCPGAGWIDFDPTNNHLVGTRHITLAWGRDYADVCPLKGVFLGGGAHTLQVSVDVLPTPV
ncbi:MAG: transglutaminase N-terminal domain-containing protein [Planctomycetota bacterium]